MLVPFAGDFDLSLDTSFMDSGTTPSPAAAGSGSGSGIDWSSLAKGALQLTTNTVLGRSAGVPAAPQARTAASYSSVPFSAGSQSAPKKTTSVLPIVLLLGGAGVAAYFLLKK